MSAPRAVWTEADYSWSPLRDRGRLIRRRSDKATRVMLGRYFATQERTNRHESPLRKGAPAGAPFALPTGMSGTAPRVSMWRMAMWQMAGIQREDITERAFAIYTRRSSSNQQGSSFDDWLQAERELWRERFAASA